jgi:hypothetical protein
MPLTSAYTAELARQLNLTCNGVETTRGVVVPPTVRGFLELVATESVLFRANEWLQHHNLKCDDPTQLDQTVPKTATAANSVLSAATPTTGDYISLASVLAAIHKNWCGIFPFCQ